MIEKIKTLLDSGCLVKVKYFEDGYTDVFKVYGYNDDNLITDCGVEEFDYVLYVFEHTFDGKISIEPILRPLFKYKVGDMVLVLSNYEGKVFKVGKKYKVVGMF